MTPLNHISRCSLKPRFIIVVVVLVMAFAPVIGCSTGSKPTPNNANAPAAASPKAPQGKGMFKTEYAPVKNPEYAKRPRGALRRQIQSTRQELVALARSAFEEVETRVFASVA
jgi:hypothetical protein